MKKPQIHKLPILQPTEPDNPSPKRKRKVRPKVTKLHKTLLEQLQEQNGEQTAWQRIKEVAEDFGKDMRERVYHFFGTCLGEIVLLCIITMLIAGFIVLFLELGGHVK